MTAHLATLTGLMALAFGKAQHTDALPELRGLLGGLTAALALLTASTWQ
ncbi:hypothetical protein OG730_41885 (plasmid) [Streptomyces sp. NBC_01298]|nr:hypothetical protein OG730_41885 [Streptomyces sp. NBC_01298]